MSTVTLNWTADTLNTDGSTITGPITYNVYQGVNATSLTKVQSGLTTPSAIVTAGLTPGTTQFFAVTTVAEGQESADSLVVHAIIAPLVPAAPTGLTAALS